MIFCEYHSSPNFKNSATSAPSFLGTTFQGITPRPHQAHCVLQPLPEKYSPCPSALLRTTCAAAALRSSARSEGEMVIQGGNRIPGMRKQRCSLLHVACISTLGAASAHGDYVSSTFSCKYPDRRPRQTPFQECELLVRLRPAPRGQFV